MIPLEELKLPADLIEKIRNAGYRTVEHLHASNHYTLRIRAGFGDADVRRVIASMRMIGWDFKVPGEDPVGSEEIPSVRAMKFLMERLRLAPRSEKSLKIYLLGVCTVPELLEWIDPADKETVLQLLCLMGIEA